MSKITDYNDISRSYDSVREPADACILKSLMESLTGKCVKDMDIIDIGCGTGNFSEYFLRFEPRNLALMDASEGMLSKAKEKLQSVPPSTYLSFKHAVLPNMPYEDHSFDAAMMNLVLHHLEQDPDGKSFPKIVQTFKEVLRILKPGGVLTIISVTPEQLEANWFAHLVPKNKERWHKRLLSHDQLKNCLSEAGLTLKSAYNTLTASYHPDHLNPEGPLSEAWRRSISFWGTCSEDEIKDMVQNVTRMKNEGTLQEYVDTNEKLGIYGALHISASKKEVQ